MIKSGQSDFNFTFSELLKRMLRWPENISKLWLNCVSLLLSCARAQTLTCPEPNQTDFSPFFSETKTLFNYKNLYQLMCYQTKLLLVKSSLEIKHKTD